MEPQIRYTTTIDGVGVAYYAMGEGHPLLVASGVVFGHLRLAPFQEYHRSRSRQGALPGSGYADEVAGRAAGA